MDTRAPCAQSGARLGRQDPARGRQAGAPRAHGAARRVTEEHGLRERNRRLAATADIHCGSQAQLSDDPPGTGEGSLPGFAGGRRANGVEGVDNGLEQLGIRCLASKTQRELGDG